MPLYQFRCRSCDHQFQTFFWDQNFPPQVFCPQCQGTDLYERLLEEYPWEDVWAVLGCG